VSGAAALALDVRFTPESGQAHRQSVCPLSANSVTSHCGNQGGFSPITRGVYSITSSARASKDGDTVSPSILAV
jgi:hypothetical protein